ncbi:MAG: glycosyltransferase [Candidatus Cloacimonetes bacterium]|nr:glycosyltransferase [Candidatus Cloacimonadota bacterium]
MRISLIIPVFNRLQLLEKCLLSVFQQSLLPDEIILSDDGSEEDIVSFYRSLIIKTQITVKLVRQENEGFRLARVRNNAASLARGEILAFIDQDILISQGYLQVISNRICPGIFLSGYPVRLDNAQNELFTKQTITQGSYRSVITKAQAQKLQRQYRKDLISYLLYRYIRIGRRGAKLRGGVCAILKDDYVRVNGYDENYIGWGNEDDDMGRRLLAAGVLGLNFVKDEFPIHLFHEPFHSNGNRINRSYAQGRKKEISKKDFRCNRGLSDPRPDISIYQ